MNRPDKKPSPKKTILRMIYEVFKPLRIATQVEIVFALSLPLSVGPTESAARPVCFKLLYNARLYKRELSSLPLSTLLESGTKLADKLADKLKGKDEAIRIGILREILCALIRDHTDEIACDGKVVQLHLEQAIASNNDRLFFAQLLAVIAREEVQDFSAIAGSEALFNNGHTPFITDEEITEYNEFSMQYGTSDYQSAVALYNKVEKRKSGNPLLHFQMGDLYFYGKFSFKRDYEKAYRYYQMAAARGHALALWSVGQILELRRVDEYSNFVENLRRVVGLYKQAIERGCFQAKNSLGKIYIRALHHLGNRNEEVFSELHGQTNSQAYQAIGPVGMGSLGGPFVAVGDIQAGAASWGNGGAPYAAEAYFDEGFRDLVEGRDLADERVFEEVEDAIVNQFFRPLVEQQEYVYACKNIASIYTSRLAHTGDATRAKYYREEINRLYRQAAELGDPWAANELGRRCELEGERIERERQEMSTGHSGRSEISRQGENSGHDGQTGSNRRDYLVQALEWYQKAAFDYFTIPTEVWPLYNWSRLILIIKDCSDHILEEAEANLLRIMEQDKQQLRRPNAKQRFRESYSLLDRYYRELHKGNNWMELKKKHLEAYNMLLELENAERVMV